MPNVFRSAPQISVVLVVSTLWASFTCGLPAHEVETPGASESAVEEFSAGDALFTLEGSKADDGDVNDPWAGVKISDAYDYAKCPRCGNKNEIRRPACSRCAYPLPQPSPDVTDPDMVFVPGKGYYREGEVVEAGGTRKDLWVPGVVLSGIGALFFTLIGGFRGAEDDLLGGENWSAVVVDVATLSLISVGATLIIFGLTIEKEPVYAFGDCEPYDYCESDYYTLRRVNSRSVALKVEVTALSF